MNQIRIAGTPIQRFLRETSTAIASTIHCLGPGETHLFQVLCGALMMVNRLELEIGWALAYTAHGHTRNLSAGFLDDLSMLVSKVDEANLKVDDSYFFDATEGPMTAFRFVLANR